MRHSFQQQSSNCGRRRNLLLRLLCSFVLTALPISTHAAPPSNGLASGWATAELDHFSVHVQRDEGAAAWTFAATYGNYLEQAIRELTLIFPDGTPSERISIYAYTEQSSFESSILAIDRNEIPAITAFADSASHDISVFLPSFEKLSDVEVENQLRHALSHVVTSIASGGLIPWGFDEGIAQYVERPVNEKLARTAAIVQSAYQHGDIVSWVDMNLTSALVEPSIAAAQSYATIAFLIDSYDLAPLRDFLSELKTADNWRTAMRSAYGRVPNSVEKQWKEKLNRWTTNDWRRNLVAGFDLDPARILLEQANYAAAKAALDPAQRLFRQLDTPDELRVIETMIGQCDIGIQADSLITQTQQALSLHTYDRAVNLLAQAKLQFSQLPAEHQPTELIATYEQLANDGVMAGTQLDTATRLAHSWRDYPDAREAAVAAGTTFARLGDEDGVVQAQAVLDDLDKRQRRIVLLLAALAMVTLAWLGLWLWSHGPTNLSWR